MITLAFAQMAYYIVSGLARYGGDDGLTIYKRSDFGGLIDLSNRVQFYYLCVGCLLGCVYLIWRIVNSRFGLVVQGLRSNERRMQAIGFPVNRYRLVCFVISGTICGLAGALLANNTDFVSPASDVLDPFRRSDGDGGARRHGLAVRPGDRGHRVSACWKSSCRR